MKRRTIHARFGRGAELEVLEERVLLNGASRVQQRYDRLARIIGRRVHAHSDMVMSSKGVRTHAATPPATALTPAQVRGAYGVDQITWGAIEGDGTGQTIAIVDAYDYPTAYNDLQVFNAQFGLPDLQLWSVGGNTGPWFRRVAQDGSTNYPITDPAGAGNPNGTWEEEAALDVQWAHAIAPGANIILVESNSTSLTDMLDGAVVWAAAQPGVSVVSMSFGSGEFVGEAGFDSDFVTPSGHQGVTFVASTGDAGAPSGYPAFSPNVVAIGGTHLTVNGTTWGGETGWSGSGGSVSMWESQPSYQNGVVSAQSTTKRTNPDVAMDADPATGVAVYDSWDFGVNGWFKVGGTSLSAPMWGGLVAIANQGRVLAGKGTLDGRGDTLPMLYSMSASNFHDIVDGDNGNSALVGYDLVTGRGSPVANMLVPALAGVGSVSGFVWQDNDSDGVKEAGEPGLAGVTVYVDGNNNGVRDNGSSANVASTDVPKDIPDRSSTGVTSTLAIANLPGPITDVNIKLNITHTFDGDLSAYLTSPSGTQIQLFNKIGSSGDNYTNTTFDQQAATSITAGSPPYTGTFRPSPGSLSTFNGENPNGTWSLKVTDTGRKDTGTLDSWSLAITTGPEASTTTDAAGAYNFDGLTYGSTVVLRQMLPANFIEETPGGAAGLSKTINGTVTGANFGDFPTVVTFATPSAGYYVRLDSTQTMLQIDSGDAPQSTHLYQVVLSKLPSFKINLLGDSDRVTMDYTNVAPIPAGNFTVHGSTATRLNIVGQGSTFTFNLSDTALARPSARTVFFDSIDTLRVTNCTVTYIGAGDLATVNTLEIGAGAKVVW